MNGLLATVSISVGRRLPFLDEFRFSARLRTSERVAFRSDIFFDIPTSHSNSLRRFRHPYFNFDPLTSFVPSPPRAFDFQHVTKFPDTTSFVVKDLLTSYINSLPFATCGAMTYSIFRANTVATSNNRVFNVLIGRTPSDTLPSI